MRCVQAEQEKLICNAVGICDCRFKIGLQPMTIVG
jgi:hypothetical protein